MNHAKHTLENQAIGEYHRWVDSTTVLYWIKGQGTWSVFVRNRTKTIQAKNYLQWSYVPTSRAVGPGKLSDLWFQGPDWLTNERSWLQQPEVTENTETSQEKVQPKPEKQFLATEIKGEQNGPVDALLFKFSSYQKLLRVTACIKRFIRNCKGGDKRGGLVTTEELQESKDFWIIQAQSSQGLKPDVQLKKGGDGVWRCAGRVPNYHPVFLPRGHRLTTLIIEQGHKQRLHGGAATTMSRVRERFWTPKLLSLVKKVVHHCNVCHCYRVKPLKSAAKVNSQL